MPEPDGATVKALKRVQNTARTRLRAGEQTYMTRRVQGETRKALVYSLDTVEAVKLAEAQLVADRHFEHLDQVEDRLWLLAERAQLDRRGDHVSTFIDEHAQDLVTLAYRVSIDHLGVDSPVDFLGVRLGPLDAELASEEDWPSAGPTATSQATVTTTGTSHERMADRARAQVERVLRVLRFAIQDVHSATSLELRFQVGSFILFDDCVGVWSPSDRGVGRSFTLRQSSFEAVERHVAAGLCNEPFHDVEKKADVALRWIERAVFTADPLVSLLFQFFALEALLGDMSQGLKSAQLAFRRAMLSCVATDAFRHPSTTLML